eukprot:m.51132 g.51132  ORF g.51132 m.51132 type:complete len:72 (-) comp11225_c0_seq1:1065-1280(-)
MSCDITCFLFFPVAQKPFCFFNIYLRTWLIKKYFFFFLSLPPLLHNAVSALFYATLRRGLWSRAVCVLAVS